MAKITLEQAARWCGGRVAEKYKDVIFDGATNDTRTLRGGQLFVALVGLRDGNDFIPMAFEKGAAAVLTAKATDAYPAIIVEDPRIALGKIAAGLRRERKIRVIGVTGSVGKSTTKEMIAAVLEGDLIVSKTPANFNNDLGMPMSILAMDEDTEVAVLEMGMSHRGEISYLSHIARPDIGVITNIGTMHIENLGSRQGILQAKLEICDGMGQESCLILNGDEPLLWEQRERLGRRILSFGKENSRSSLFAEKIRQDQGSMTVSLRMGEQRFDLTLPLEGEHFVSDALAAVAVGICMGIPVEHMVSRLSRFQNMAGRQEIFEARGCTIIKDCYNAGPESMEAALKVLGKRQGRRIAVLGDMLELGQHSLQAHEKLGVLAAENADILLAYGPNGKVVTRMAHHAGMKPEQALDFEDREQMAETLKRICRPKDVLLFKGSHGMHMEQVLEKFLNEE